MSIDIGTKIADDPLKAGVRSQTKVNANDFRQLAALRRDARADDPAALREVARQFESIFTKMMLDSMRAASFGDPMFGSDQGDMYQGMMDDQLAVEMSQGKGIGLADMLIKQLSHGAVTGATGGAGALVTPGLEKSLPVSPPVSEEAKQKFIEKLLPQAQAAGRELGVDPRAIIAQAALETGWGTSQPGGANASHNLFGIKAGADWQGAAVDSGTVEFEAGVAKDEVARFRVYGSAQDSVDDYVSLLRDNPRYAAALDTGDDVAAFAGALQRGGYATDPHYANKLVAVAQKVSEQLGGRQPVAAFLKTDHAEPITPHES
ncbi:MAG TPA: glucosaminidase domain-containing protein [Steroidobacteraceae bacterium]|jgi:flagellar protein FlgJ|nr:glucosaminidase domain-containing protein [Steroidobacteraceae bacterium]